MVCSIEKRTSCMVLFLLLAPTRTYSNYTGVFSKVTLLLRDATSKRSVFCSVDHEYVSCCRNSRGVDVMDFESIHLIAKGSCLAVLLVAMSAYCDMLVINGSNEVVSTFAALGSLRWRS